MLDIMKALDNLMAFNDEGNELIGSLNDDVDDYYHMCLICGDLFNLSKRLFDHIQIVRLVYDMENEKDRFEVQKMQKRHFQSFLEDWENLKKDGRLFKFEDYRCIEWVQRLTMFLDRINEVWGDCNENVEVSLDNNL